MREFAEATGEWTESSEFSLKAKRVGWRFRCVRRVGTPHAARTRTVWVVSQIGLLITDGQSVDFLADAPGCEGTPA